MMRAFCVSLLVLLTIPAAALARHRLVFPTGNSSVNQYVEIVPTATGGQPSDKIHPSVVSPGSGGGTGGGSASGGSSGGGASGSGSAGGGSTGPNGAAVAPSTGSALAKAGSVGLQAAAVARATAPAGVHGVPATRVRHRQPAGGGAGPGSAQASTGTTSPQSHSRSPAAQVLAALTGSATHGGLGTLLPALLVLTVLAVATFALRRRRDRPA